MKGSEASSMLFTKCIMMWETTIFTTALPTTPTLQSSSMTIQNKYTKTIDSLFWVLVWTI